MPFLTDMLQEAEMDRRNVIAGEINQQSQHGLDDGQAPFDPVRVMRYVRANIFGQEHVLQSIEDILYVAASPIGDKSRPLFVALLLGPTGVGKTELVRVLSRAIYADAERFCRIDMNTLSQAHYSAAITGAPPGYAGSKEGHSLLSHDLIEGEDDRPGLVLFDEIEKASEPVTLSLMNIFDNGRLVLTSGERSYDFRNSLIFMTSNLGARELETWLSKYRPWAVLRRQVTSRASIEKKIIGRVLNKQFLPEFLNRVDDILTFRALDQDAFAQVIEKRIEEIKVQLLSQRIRLEAGEEITELFLSFGFDRRYGARAINRTIRKYLEIPLAKFIVNGKNLIAEKGMTQIACMRESDQGDPHVRFKAVPAEDESSC